MNRLLFISHMYEPEFVIEMLFWVYMLAMIWELVSGQGCGSEIATPYKWDCSYDTELTTIAKPPSSDSITVLELTGCRNLQLEDTDFSIFFDNLEQLLLTEVQMSNQKKKVSLDKFSKFKKLTNMQFADGGLTDSEMWILPNSLQTYSITKNGYTKLDLSTSTTIITIFADFNNLQDVPTLPSSSQIATIHLQGNPLDKMTVESVAPYCKLKSLELNFPSSSFLLSENGACECQRLRKWVITFNLTDTSFDNRNNCSQIKNDVYCDLNFTYVKDIRRHCPDAYLLPEPPTTASSKLWMIIAGAIISLLLLSLIIYFTVFRKKQEDSEELNEETPLEEEPIDDTTDKEDEMGEG